MASPFPRTRMVQLPPVCPRGRSPPSISNTPTPPPSCPSFLSQTVLWMNTTKATRGGGGVGHVRQMSTVLHECTDPRLMESGGVDSGISVWIEEFRNSALDPSGTGLGNM